MARKLIRTLSETAYGLKRLVAVRTPSLTWHYRVGKLLVDAQHNQGLSVRTVVTAAKLPISLKSTLEGARLFAQRFARRQIPGLEAGGLKWAHVWRLASVESHEHRRELQQRCIAQHWSVARLGLEIRARFGRQSQAVGALNRLSGTGPGFGWGKSKNWQRFGSIVAGVI